MKPKKVLILAKHLDGGTGTFVSQLTKLECIFKGKIKLQIIGLEKPKFKVDTSLDSVEYFRSKIVLPYYYKLTPRAIYTIIQEIVWLQKKITLINPDVLLAIDNHCNIVVCIVKLLSSTIYKFRLVLTIHNNASAVVFYKLTPLTRRLLQLVCKYLYRQADEIIAVSIGLATNIQEFFSLQVKPKVIYCGLEQKLVQEFATKPIVSIEQKLFSKNKDTVLSIGRFAPQKDFITLLKAFALVVKKNNKAQLILIGDGDEKEMLKRLVFKLMLVDKVYFIGWKQNIYPYLLRSKVFVLSSHYEGFGYVLIEAMSLGIPVISTDTDYGPAEILENGKYGVLVKKSNHYEMAKAMSNLLTNHKKLKKYSDAGSKRSRFFSEAKMLRNYMTLITDQ